MILIQLMKCKLLFYYYLLNNQHFHFQSNKKKLTKVINITNKGHN